MPLTLIVPPIDWAVPVKRRLLYSSPPDSLKPVAYGCQSASKKPVPRRDVPSYARGFRRSRTPRTPLIESRECRSAL